MTDEEVTTRISVGDRIVVECGPVQTHAARVWRMLFDGEHVEGLVEIGIDGNVLGVGRRWAIFNRDCDPSSDALTHLERSGWQVVVGSMKEDPPVLDRVPHGYTKEEAEGWRDRAWAAWFFGTHR